ncbi:MAG: GGDEF domain-containing protein [Gammaproteobacteria bacterium]|nr:GGDEF domain-containing protein [Gammaproteobacteria bacterium]MCP5406084.1 GGDEF domain-containing protein [Chromatiaceae bacterium]MCP5408679.1 GGDEF domain-containing protein [Chromatiaceae bacterium]MCP5442642.1 GGDEF domain-containing protein [Chromatiaceae bacterium]
MRKEDGVNESAETLRIALPLMTRYKVPTTPENYSIWFHYVIGDRPGLNDFIDNLLEQKTPFTQDVNEHIYQQFLSDQHLQQAEQVSKTLVSALAETTAALRHTGSEADHYHSVLSSFDKSCGSAQSLTDVFELLNTVLKETQSMQQSMKRLQQDFLVKSDDMDKLRKELDQVRKQASTDALTGLYNRTTFFDSLEAVDAESNPLSNPYSVAMIDIDHFKRVNDTFGHLVGDKVIRFVADSLRQSIKGRDCAARYGGEEYALLLPETSLENAVILCNKIREHIAKTNLVRSGTKESLGQITISVGIAQKRSGEGRMDLLARADKALYLSKERGRNKVTASDE